MIIFHYIEMTNFLSIGNSPVRINLDKDDTTLIRGNNGHGKSTVLDGINYSLFSKPLRDVKLGQLVNSVNKKKCLVEVNFTVRGDNYIIRRGQKPVVFEIYKNGDLIEHDASAKDYQAKLENDIIGTNFRTFNQVVVMSSTGYTHFMELSTADRRSVVENMLDIEVVGQMSTVLKDRVKEVKAKGATLDNNYNSLTRSIQEVKSLIEQAKNMGDAEVVRIDSNITAIDEAITTIELELAECKMSHASQVDDKPVFNQEEETLRHRAASTELAGIDNKIKLLQDDINNSKQSAGVFNGEIRSLDFQISEYNNTKSFYVENDNCDRCNQPIDDQFKANVVDDMDGKISSCSHDRSNIQFDVAKLKDKVDECNSLVAGVNEGKLTHQTIINEVGAIVASVKQWQANCDSIISKARGISAQLKGQQDVKNRLLSDKQEVLAKGNTDTGAYYDNIASLNDDIEQLARTRAEINEEAELCKLAEEMLKDKGLKAKIIKQFLPVINSTINNYLESMNANYSFTLDEMFNETIKSRYRDSFTYGSFSNGERFRINVAVLFLWRKLAESKNTIASNLLFLDEVLDSSLDKEGIDNLFDIFATMPKSNIFVISHRPEIVDRFTHTIEVTKKGNFSHYDGI